MQSVIILTIYWELGFDVNSYQCTSSKGTFRERWLLFFTKYKQKRQILNKVKWIWGIVKMKNSTEYKNNHFSWYIRDRIIKLLISEENGKSIFPPISLE